MDQKSPLFYFSGIMTAVFALLTIWSLAAGNAVVTERIPETAFEKEAFKRPHATFNLEKSSVVELTLNGATLYNSWIWAKVVIVDQNNEAVLDKTFELNYYAGSGWSEGDRDESWSFYLPKGNYKVLVYGEDAEKRSGWTTPRAETLEVIVETNAVLTRYFLIGLILFGAIFGWYIMRIFNEHAERQQQQNTWG